MRTNGSRQRSRAATMLVGAAVVSLLAAACSSDNKSSSTTAGGGTETTTAGGTETTTASTGTEGATTTVADVLGTPNKATGDPIVIGVINEGGGDTVNQQSENTAKGMQIAADYANEYLGGIAGHPIKLEICGNKNTPAGATACANQLVEKKVNLYTDPYSGFEGDIVKVLVPAGIPMLVGSSSSQEGLTTPGVFAMTGGYPANLGAMAIDAKAAGVKKFAMIVTDVPAASGAASALGGIVFKKEGVDFTTVAVPLGTADFTPQLQQAIADGADALGVTGDASFCTSFFNAYKTLGLTAKKYIISVCLDPTVIQSSGDVLAGSRVGVSRQASAEDAVFAATVAKYGEAGTDATIGGGIADGWSTLISVVNTFKGYTGPIDNASLLAAIKAAKDVPLALSGGLTFTCDGTAISILANICSAQIQMATVDAKGQLSDITAVDAAEAFAS